MRSSVGEESRDESCRLADGSKIVDRQIDLGRWKIGGAFVNRDKAMGDATRKIRLVMTTCDSSEEAARLGRTLVEERLAACATLIPGVRSIYRWQGALEDATEVLLLLKTSAELVGALEERLHALHRYETPEFLVLGVEEGSHRYVAWLLGNVGPESSGS
jgi:periplasmic divalent cation tolerance protein